MDSSEGVACGSGHEGWSWVGRDVEPDAAWALCMGVWVAVEVGSAVRVGG